MRSGRKKIRNHPNGTLALGFRSVGVPGRKRSAVEADERSATRRDRDRVPAGARAGRVLGVAAGPGRHEGVVIARLDDGGRGGAADRSERGLPALRLRREPAVPRGEPVPPAPREQPGRLVSLGRGGLRARARRGQAGLPVCRLQHLLLVSCDGAGGLLESRDRRTDECALHLDQGRPRGASGHRRRLHVGDAAADGIGRLAQFGVPHAGRAPLLRRHLLPAGGHGGTARVSRAC